MAKMKKEAPKSSRTKSNVEWKFPLEKQNLMIIGVGFAVILMGYLLMSTGISNEPAHLDGKWNNFFAVDLAPLLLVIGYCVIIPLGILKKFNTQTAGETV